MAEPSKLPIASQKGRWKRMNAHKRLSPENRRKARLLSEREAADRAKHGINVGLNEREIAALTRIENAQTKRRTEQANIIDENGNILLKKGGAKAKVSFTQAEARLMNDAILTHNHPGGVRGDLGAGMASRIGTAVNGVDVAAAMRNNAKEIRASTQGYVFSVKRPKGGWKGNPDEVAADFNRAFRRADLGWADSYVNRRGLTMQQKLVRLARFNVGTQDQIMKQLAKKYGFTYTRRKM